MLTGAKPNQEKDPHNDMFYFFSLLIHFNPNPNCPRFKNYKLKYNSVIF